jgi:30S ribosomal protein S31
LEKHVGKGDRRTRRGKIYAGSFGKSRPKDPKAKKAGGKPAAAARAPAKSAARPARKAKA